MSEADKFNFTVRELRILLNKLSKDNFDIVSKKILHDHSFTPSLLTELMKIIFQKATTEATYLELYVKLCILLFKKYNDKENKEMNFKKLLLMKCQKQFYKIYEKEEQERRSRRESMQSFDEADGTKQQQQESEFSKQMQFVFSAEELRHRLKLQLFGNMRLIAELYVHNQIPEDIIITCITSLLDEVNDQSIEILCQMLPKIAGNLVRRAIREREDALADNGESQHSSTEKPRRRKKSSYRTHSINLDYVESIMKKVFDYRQSELLSSRVRFKIQDLMDDYEREWKKTMQEEKMLFDNEGFAYKYVPKETIAAENGAAQYQKKNKAPLASGQKQAKQEEDQKGFIYVKKNQEQQPSSSSKQPSRGSSAKKEN